MAKVLLVDEEMTMVQMVSELLRSEGHQVVPFTNSQSAVDRLSTVAPELVIANLSFEKGLPASLNVLQKARALNPPALVIMITASGSLDTTMDAMRRGVYDCLHKPFSVDEFKLRTQRALSYHTALSENVCLRKQLQTRSQLQQMLTASARMEDILATVARVAELDHPILICGESGTGKKTMARAVHGASRRQLAPFIAIKCNALPEPLLEIELFGERKSLFGSTLQEKTGLFQEAAGGTVFLDDVHLLPLSLQTRLITLLQDAQPGAARDNRDAPIDVRILAACTQALHAKVMERAFREDLFQHLSPITLELPSLRERAEDIPLLMAHFLEGRTNPKNGQPYILTRDAVQLCCSYDWPGNITELKRAVEHACVVCQDGAIQASDLPRAVQPIRLAPDPVYRNGTSPNGHQPAVASRAVARAIPSAELGEQRLMEMTSGQEDLLPLKRFLRDQEISYLQRTLALVDGSKEKAAELLGISLATMYRKLSEPESATDML